MVIHGHDTTLPATLGLMAMHTRAVAHAADGKFVIADLPFLSYRKGVPAAMTAVGVLVRNGAQAVKLEGVDGHEDVIGQIVGSGVPVMGHLGLTPQSVNGLGGFRVQGRNDVDAAKQPARRTNSSALGASPSCSNACRPRSPPGSQRL
jgi:3-methyl-2-oxobutanoate hydroxymethyltransferase